MAMAGSLHALAEATVTVSRFVVGKRTLEETLNDVAATVQEALPPVSAVSVTMLDNGRPTTTAYTRPVALALDEVQYETGRGPCLDAYRTRAVRRVDSTERDERWPEYSDAARHHDIQSSLSLPLMVEDDSLGAMNLYSEGEFSISDEDEALGLSLAAQVGVALASAREYWGAQNLVRQLNQALESRATIEQAKGILMALEGIGPDAAFGILRSVSQRENRKLREVASDLVEKAQRRHADPPAEVPLSDADAVAG